MKGTYLKFYTQENRRHGSKLVHEWLVETGRELSLPGCSVFHAVAGYGHHRVMHSEHFFELQGQLPMEIVFALSDEQARALIDRISNEGVEVFWVSIPAEFGFLPAEAGSID